MIKDYSGLYQFIKKQQSFLCVGLDSDISRIPQHIIEKEEDPIFEFNKAIIDATKDLCVAYKPNIAFYESLGPNGWHSLKKTLDYIPKSHFTIADAKRGDIGNTSIQYAKTFFESLSFDSITVAPYMGEDSIKPFLTFKDKWVILLALTSNKGSLDFQLIEDKMGVPLYKEVLKKSSQWGSVENMMYVVGATKPTFLSEIRKIIPNHFLLVPGVGAQGGSLSEVCKYGLNDKVGLLVNSSRSIIFASSGIDFAKAARSAAASIQQEMKSILDSM